MFCNIQISYATIKSSWPRKSTRAECIGRVYELSLAWMCAACVLVDSLGVEVFGPEEEGHTMCESERHHRLAVSARPARTPYRAACLTLDWATLTVRVKQAQPAHPRLKSIHPAHETKTRKQT